MLDKSEDHILVAGHPMVVDVNREIWSKLAEKHKIKTDVCIPSVWKSNLIKNLKYQSSKADQYFERVFPVKTFFKGNGSLYFFNPLSLFSILQNKKYKKIILTQETWSLSLFVLWMIKLFTRNNSTKIYLWVCQNIKKEKFYFLRFFERMICQDVQRIMGCCSETMEVTRWKGLNAEEYYFPFSYESKRFNFKPEVNGKIKIGYIGRISEEKGIHEIIEVINSEDWEQIEFHFAGAGNLEHLISNHPKINFHGALNHSEVNEFYETMNIILLPSKTKHFWKEQFGRVIIEGLSSGCDVIGSDSGAIKEVMTILGVEDFNFEEGNQIQFKARIKKAIELVHDYDRKKKNADKTKLTFSHEAIADLMYQYLDDENNKKGMIDTKGRICGYT